ncbi:MAG: nuclear transport factor 2 family protein [Acidobacteriota bacterium]
MDGEIKAVVEQITAAWIAGRFDELREYFHPDVVLAQPGFAGRTVGREALIASYADFAREATIHSLTTGEIHIDRAGDSAVTTMPWTMDYEFGGQRYEEKGWDLLVFGRREGKWIVVWRTVVVER